MRFSAKRTWVTVAACLAAVAATVVAGDWYSALPPDALDRAQYVGRAACAQCHAAEHKLWLGSHHDRAMELATDESVLGDFNNAAFTRLGVTTRFFREGGKYMVNTEGPDGQNHDYEIKYTFGVEPLQQYMVEFPRGRVQVLRVSWDTQKKEWFEVTPPDVQDERIPPGDPVHWTGIGQNWNTTCADCHSTNLQKNYDPVTDSYRTTYQEIDVSCEECHGPGSVHVDLAQSRSLFWDRNVGYGLPRLKSLDPDVQLQTCAKCHSHRAQVHEEFRPGKPLLDYYVPSLLTTGLYHDDGQIRDEVYEHGSFVQSKMYAQRVRCSDCHDPHSLKLKFTGNRLCSECHVAGKYDTPAHHHHTAGSAAAQCVECHMPARLYMVIDSRRDHSFRVPRPDLSVKLGTPNACTNCHTRPGEDNEWAAAAVRKWYGEKRPDDPHWAPAFAAAQRNAPEGEQLLLDLVKRRSTPAIVRASAIDLLAGYTSNRSIDARRLALDDFDPLIRRTAVIAADSENISALERDLAGRLSDSALAVRNSAVTRLAYLPRQTLTNNERLRFAQVLDDYRESQSLSLDHAGGHLALGGLDRHNAERLRGTGLFDEAAVLEARATEHWRAAIRLEPYIAGPRGELASMLERQKGDPAEIHRLRVEEVELRARDAKLAPDNGEIHYQLGMMYVLLGRLEEASDALTSACRALPQSYICRMGLALVYQRRYELTGNEELFNATVRELKTLHDLAPKDPRSDAILRDLLKTRQSKLGGSAGLPAK
ncbi:MAG: multiheme c-type cytochrome [Pirellulales bacterium]